MVLGTHPVSCRWLPDSSVKIIPDNNAVDSGILTIASGTIVEYDRAGNVVWTWESSKYFEKIDHKKNASSLSRGCLDLHENSFFFDEKDKIIYLSFRNMNQVVKIKYPEGTIIGTIGEETPKTTQNKKNNLFYGQHSVKRTSDGSIVLFNNNTQHGPFPTILKIKEPALINDHAKITWEYKCTSNVASKNGYVSGGNVVELPDNSMLVSMAIPANEIFIVNKDKHIVWSAATERYDDGQKKWLPLARYRASIIEGKQQLERLIWGGEVNPGISQNSFAPIKSNRSQP